MTEEQRLGDVANARRDNRAQGVAATIPAWADDALTTRKVLGTAALGIASIMLATDVADAQQAQSTSPLPSVQVDAPRARRAARPAVRPAARPPRVAATPRPAAAAPAPVGIVSNLSPANTNVVGTGLSRFPGNIQNTPQIVNVVSEQIMREQNVTTLDQALRNVPGVTVSAGEGNGGLQGDQFRIRGFSAQSDLYLDGLRDFGVYTRDAFATESVQVFKGPSSEGFGIGATGGAINQLSKTAKLGSFYAADVLLGTGLWGRGTFDINHQMNANQAFRIYGMANKQDIAGRDNVKSDRYGVGASFATGLATDTTWTLNYLYQNNERTPDYGVPIIGRGTGVGAGNGVPTISQPGIPVTELGLPRSIFYGKDTDIDRTNAHMLTSRLKHEFAPWLTISNDTRLSYFDRYFSTSGPSCDTACAVSFFNGGNPVMTYTGGNPAYDQKTWAIQNLTTVNAKFNTGFLRHEMVAGLDLFYAENDRMYYWTQGTKAGQPIRSPIFASSGYSLQPNAFNTRKSSGSDVGVFVGDRIWFTDIFSIQAGVRWDRYDIEHTQGASATGTATGNIPPAFGSLVTQNSSTSFAVPRVSAILEPWKNQIIYGTYSESATPAGTFITSAPQALNPAQPGLQPERAKTYEAGFKMSALNNRIGFTGAGFQIRKSNALFTDPVTGDLVATGEVQQVQGVELGVSGQITPAWNLMLGYAMLQSEILTSATAANVGNEVQGVARNNFSMWTTYNLSTLVPTGSGRLTAGFGAFYRDAVFTSSTNTLKVPSSLSFDAMLSYEWDKYRIAGNVYNISNETNYDTFFNSRAVPNAGRTFTVSGSVRW